MKTKRAALAILPVILLLLQQPAISASPEIRSLNRLQADLPSMEQSARNLPVIAQADVVVAGGGLAGVSAALRAAREGRSVILVEERNCLAHEATVAWDCALGETGSVTSGLLDTLKQGGVVKGGMLNPVKLKTAIHQAVAAQSRIRVLFFSLPAGVVMEGNRVCGLVIVNHAGRQIVSCRAVVDATEQSHIAAAAGAKFDGNKCNERIVKRLAVISPKPEPAIARSVVAISSMKDCSVTSGPQYVEFVCKMPATDDIAADWSRGQAATLSMFFALRDAMTKNGILIKEFAVSPEITMTDERRVCCRASEGGATCLPEGIEGLVMATPAPAQAGAAALLAAGETAGKIAAASVQKDRDSDKASESAAPPAGDATRPQIKELLAGPETGVHYPWLHQDAQRLPVAMQCDVIVVGGGTSGAFAAMAAARQKARVVLVEVLPNLGGTSSNRVNTYYWGVSWKSALSEDVDEGISTRQNTGPGGLEKVSFSGEEKKRALQELALKAGVQILYRSFGAGVVVERDRVIGVVVENASGRQVILSKTVVDATGHADLAAAAGAAFEKGRPKDGFLHEAEHGPLRDSTDAEDLSKYYLKQPSYALSLNIRESRRICGDYTLTFDDVIHGRRFPDVVARWRSNYDSHFPHSANQDDQAQDWIAIFGLFRKPILGDIPYRCLLPKGLENILVVGKAYSATHDALIGARMQRDLQHLGEAAGVAAVMACRAGVPPRQLPMSSLQSELVRLRVLRTEDLAETQTTLPDVAALAARLGTKQSLDAMVELYLAGERAVPALKPVLNAADAAARTEAALVLGMLRQRESIPVLLDVLARRDSRRFTFTLPNASSRPSVPAFHAAVILLGRMQAKEAAGPIGSLLRDPKQCPPELASFAIAALAKIGDHVAVDAIKPYLDIGEPTELRNENNGFERHWGIRTNAARALAKLGDESGVPMLIGLLDADQVLLRNHAQQLLEEISGCSFGKDRKAWKKWWKKRAQGLKPVK